MSLTSPALRAELLRERLRNLRQQAACAFIGLFAGVGLVGLAAWSHWPQTEAVVTEEGYIRLPVQYRPMLDGANGIGIAYTKGGAEIEHGVYFSWGGDMKYQQHWLRNDTP